ncbi:XylR N-terminal domain-containing protein [Bacillus sp. ISL-18]|uniref:XylR N-terminal domain-containing protein n=1 Tax=Bacillus sp. ISL-18 TaxID=2819118 RepID=UPI001BE86BFA|nr:XylR N-terminal domain-containing protein [Bacillus sp. ISL-18]MBT2655582.1 XylR N-terminal domain-containing protein [Bacillus sp. ISL-18]
MHIKNTFELPKETVLNEFYERMITIPIKARTNLKNELIHIIGIERTRGVFIRYGWHCGVSDAEKAMSLQWDDGFWCFLALNYICFMVI